MRPHLLTSSPAGGGGERHSDSSSLNGRGSKTEGTEGSDTEEEKVPVEFGEKNYSLVDLSLWLGKVTGSRGEEKGSREEFLRHSGKLGEQRIPGRSGSRGRRIHVLRQNRRH